MNENYISSEWLRPLEEAFAKGRKKRRLPLIDVELDLDDIQRLLATYVEPLCRYRDHFGNSGKTSCVAFDAINLFLGDGIDADRRGGNQLWVLGDQGVGKSTLLQLLKIAYELRIRRPQFFYWTDSTRFVWTRDRSERIVSSCSLLRRAFAACSLLAITVSSFRAYATEIVGMEMASLENSIA